VSRRHLNPQGAIGHDTDATVCRWNTLDGTHPGIAVGADMSHNLEWVYQHRAEFGSFQPSDVSHYPAADTTAGGHTPFDSTCTTRVGIANNSLLIVTAGYAGARSRLTKDPCGEAESVAFEIITQMLGSS
jgi:hypothetical protein